MRPWVGAKLLEVFGADLRSLATFRIVLALLVLADLASRVTDLIAHYSDQGILPRAAVTQNPYVLSPYSFSLNLMNGQPQFQALLFGITALAALAMAVGYRTRTATFVVWVLVLSIHHRNMLVNHAGDVLLQLLLFWSLFLPLGAIWSMDRARQAAPRRLSTRFFSLATAALFMQIAFMYWFTVLLKLSGEEWRGGTALYYTFSNDLITKPIGAFLLHFPSLLTVGTFATVALEALGPLLLFCPVKTGPVRTAAVLAVMSLHFGIWLTLQVGTFPWISAFCMVCFLPAWFWDTVVPKVRTALPGQTNLARRLQPLRDAATHLAQNHLLPLRARSFAGMGGVGGSSTLSVTMRGGRPGSDASSDNASRGQHGVSQAGEPVVLRSSLATNLIALFLLFYVLCWNLTTVSSFPMPRAASPLGPFLGLTQEWVMFAPHPPTDNGWWVLPGNLQGGQQVDLMSVVHNDYGLREVSYEEPRNGPKAVNNEHWHKYLDNLTNMEIYHNNLPEWRDNAREQRENFGHYLCQAWNERHTGDERLENLQIDYVSEKTLPNREHSKPENITLLSNYSC
jgi:hypothetical protein